MRGGADNILHGGVCSGDLVEIELIHKFSSIKIKIVAISSDFD